MTALSVNLNKVCLLRNQRALTYPSPVEAGRVALAAGAHGLTLHPRPDERHVRAADVRPVGAVCREAGREFNLEGNPFEGRFVEHCREARPTQATLVPDTPGQNTSDHGWDVPADAQRLRPIIAELKGLGCRVSLFLDHDADPAAAAGVGADRVELYTEPYATGEVPVAAFADAARAAAAAGLGVNAGHDLTLDNLGPFLAAVPHVAEVSIGHALVADALFMGLDRAVREYVKSCT